MQRYGERKTGGRLKDGVRRFILWQFSVQLCVFSEYLCVTPYR